MADPKVVDELNAAIERGKKAESTLAKLEALDAVELASDVERFQRLSQAERAEIRRKHPEHYATMWQKVGEAAAERLRNKGGR